ncbi:hypothetical protein [Streptomyces sp. NPDC054783]
MPGANRWRNPEDDLPPDFELNRDVHYDAIRQPQDGDLTGSDKESQDVSMLALHLLRSPLVHVNTLLLQDILSEEK